jgi:hypothetical protein
MQKLKAMAERLTLPAVLVHFFRFAPTAIELDCGSRDASRMMGRTLAAVSWITRPISSLATPQERSNDTNTVRQARTTASATTLQRPAMTVQPQSPNDYRQSSERGRARKCVLCPKTVVATKMWQPNNHSAAALHLVPRGRSQASIVLSA